MQTLIITILIIYGVYVSILNLVNMYSKKYYEKLYLEEFRISQKYKFKNEKYLNQYMQQYSNLINLESRVEDLKILAFDSYIDTNVEIKDKMKEILLAPKNNSNIPESTEQELFSYMNDSK